MEIKFGNSQQFDSIKMPAPKKLSPTELTFSKVQSSFGYIKTDVDQSKILIGANNSFFPPSEDLYIQSVSHAIQLIKQFNRKTETDAAKRRELVNFVIATPELSGKSEDYLSLATVLETLEEYKLSINVCNYAMITKSFINSQWFVITLHAYMGDGAYSGIRQCLENAEKLPIKRWSCDLFCAAIDGYRMLWDCFQMQEDLQNETSEKVFTLCKQFQTEYPLDERGYLKEAEMHWDSCKREVAKIRLVHAIFMLQPDRDDRNRHLVCPCCCKKLLDWMKDSDDYEMIAQIARTGYRYASTSDRLDLLEFFQKRKMQIQTAIQLRQEDKPIIDTDLVSKPQVFTSSDIYGEITKEYYHERK